MEKKRNIGYRAPQFDKTEPFGNLGEEFQHLAERFGERARSCSPSWYERDAGIYFMYEEKPYWIGPGELHCKEAQFSCIRERLEEALYKLGAYEMFYNGSID